MGAPTLRGWLEGLGLAQYAEAFEQQAIDLELLPEMTDAQLEQVGVKALGHRIKLQRAAAALRSSAAPLPPAPPPEARAERRQITVLFCDLVGSTALSSRLDPEDLRALMQRYQRTCAEIVRRHQGHVAQVLGDGLMVYFGWPRAHEDDAQRAVQTALAVVEAVKGIDAAEPLRVRTGIATGAVVVGDSGEPGADAHTPRTAVGETPNLAARVQALAEPDQVLIAASTRRLVAHAFECRDLGEHVLKGLDAPVQVWRVLGESQAEGRFAAAQGGRLTPLVNRELEIGLLLERWARAGQGQGQAVLLAGEPGIGKSRVLAELTARVRAGSVLMRLQCSELHGHSSFHPFIAQLARAAGMRRDDTPEARLDKLEALLAGLGTAAARHAPYCAALMSLPLVRYPAFGSGAGTSAAKLKQETIESLVHMVLDAAQVRPVLLLVEDLHWMDPSSLEVIDALVATIRRAPVLLVMTSRSAHTARWAAQPHATALTLVGLDRGHSLQLAGAVAASHGLGARLVERLVERIVERTDGVPLFLEELTRTLAEGGNLALDRGAAEALAIPATLQDSLTARLDQLGPAKRAAQFGSVLGRSFRHDVLVALAGAADDVVQAQIDQVVAAGLASRSGSGAEAVYTFHHALIQDAAYDSLLRSERRALHARAGEILQARVGELAEHEPELLARHFTAGEAWDAAAPLWLKAGQRAWARSAAQEAIAHLEAGLAVVEKMSDPAARRMTELRLQSALGVVYFAAVSYAAPQAEAAFQRALALCESIGELTAKVPVLYGMGAFQTMKGDARAGHQAFERLRSEADTAGEPRLQLYAQSVLAWSHYNLGEHDRGIAAAERVLRLCETGALASGPRLSAADPKIISECFRAAALWALGHVDRARAASDGVLAHARALGEPYSLAYTLNFAALLVPDLCGERERVIERADEGVRLAAELGYPFLEVFGILWRSWNQGLAGDVDAASAALTAFDDAMARLATMGVRYHHGQLLARRARLLLRVERVSAAQLAIAEALAHTEASGIRSTAPDVALAEGEVLLAHADRFRGEQRALAGAAFRTAFDIARAQGARSWQLRAAIALARLAAEDEGPGAARALLAPVFEGFTEGHATADLREASALLGRWREGA
jgi:class 3 adenylate cyclase/tetratricopeptide (TPR) repeat protein